MHIRRATSADVEDIRRVHADSVRAMASPEYPRDVVEAWSTPRSVAYLRAAVADQAYFVAEVDGEVVGYAALEPSRKLVRAVYVKPSHARRGVASALLDALESEARSLGIDELRLESSLNAAPFYERHGFVAGSHATFELERGLSMESVPMRKALDEPVVLPVEDFLDLHPFAPRDIPDVVLSYLEAAREAGFTEVRLIHGRGKGVQKERVRQVLSRSELVESFEEATPDRGGWGATVARLRNLP
jgi:DNA-nicking Smr family endonuclease